MSGYLDIIFLVVLVVVIFSKLKSVLGSEVEDTKIIVVPKEQLERVYKEMKKNADKTVEKSVDLKNMTPLERDLFKIPNFDKNSFITGAQKAFEMIIQSFSKGDSKTLSMLVNKELLKKFEGVVDFRKENGITSETDLIGFVETEIESVKFVDDKVNVVVKFVSEQVNLLKSAEGEIIEGDENYVQTISDVWTFEKALNSKVNNWLLCSTKKC